MAGSNDVEAAIYDALLALAEEARTQKGMIRSTMVRDAAMAHWFLRTGATPSDAAFPLDPRTPR
ncbi:hypothetical protein [Cellulomonas chengniuliangii]|uniref:DUF222 domain-containing protein n=1 Tax=Cellulomonas chengniuliangii TaxID=2968084 RepID=A0ABY5L3Z5_9CELL|nr:hypothetical protein [Cellulomonas chengniuliangii]MCC2308130.1 hypothetical protein [Cellulomonas chengniuliangii]MCC2317138.1 hypothetical protein [Cellulomonas chengniuliangii]UUI76524.1 hypothetical protein NP064_06460 [Cellulomonas chengniuliangii]